MRVIDGKGCILGRVGARVSKMLLSGESVALVNSGELIISGNPRFIVGKYTDRRNVKNRANPEQSPHWPRRPDFLTKRIIRGMLPYSSSRGRIAFKKLKVYIGHPESLGKAEKLNGVDASRLKTRVISIRNLCKSLGYKVDR
ncbi:MAG: 50S ribosomal protein L13 [Candidatus Micrarchaeota archaeon]